MTMFVVIPAADDPPTAWAVAGFAGYPGNVSVLENRAHCKGRCSVPYHGGPFDWVWEPHKPRP